jgi:GntR family transcriptional regulator
VPVNTYDSNIPLYARIAAVLRQRIDTGQLPVGTMLPTLEALMPEFAASRVTMRLAMDLLDQEGLIERRRGFGTLVIARPKHDRRVLLPDTWEKLLERLAHMKRTMLTVDDRATPTADQLNIDDQNAPVQAARYVRMVALHKHAGEAYCHVDSWLEAKLYKSVRRALQSKPVLIVLTDTHRDCIAKVTQTMTLGLADIAVAKALDVAVGSPLALVRRTVFDRDGLLVYASRIHYPASFVRLETNLLG